MPEISRILRTNRFHKGLQSRTWKDPNRHSGINSSDCSCGLVHDDELRQGVRAREECVKLLGGRCVSPECRWQNEDGSFGCTRMDMLQIDHVDDDGAGDRSASNSYRGTNYVWILNEIKTGSTRYQCLCANCHVAKPVAKWKEKFEKWRRKNKL